MSSENRSYRTTIAVGFAISISCIAVLLRLLARRVQKLRLGADDYFIIAGLIFTTGNAVVFIFSNKYGNGRHVNTIQPADLIKYWKADYASYQLYGLAITLIKISILLFYRRVFATRQFYLRTNTIGIFVILWLLGVNLTAAFQCSPVHKAWDIEIPGRCINILNFVIGVQSANLLLDIIILALPISAVLQLQMSRAKKISVAGIFLLGGLSVVIAIVRLALLITVNAVDPTWTTSLNSWTAIEPALEVLSVSLPAMAPFLHVHTIVVDLRVFIYSLLFSHKKRSQPDDVRTFQKIDKFNQRVAAGDQTRWCSTIIAGDNVSGPTLIPLHSIVVKEDLDVVEEQDQR